MSAVLSDLYLPADILTGDMLGVSLSDILDFGHVVRIRPMTPGRPYEAGREVFHIGTPTDVYAPEVEDPSGDSTSIDGDSDGWELITSGLTGQHGYKGPWLHDSEVIAGGVARAILEHAERTSGGYYVAVYATYTCDECGGAGAVWSKADTLDETEEVECPKIATGECEPGGKTEGWAIAYRPLVIDQAGAGA